jgi:hypothetical protein
MVIELENESEATTFGPGSPATYLNNTLLKQGELIPDWYSSGHVSLDNYIAQISGQGSTPSTNSDCIDAATFSPSTLKGKFFNVSPGPNTEGGNVGGLVGADLWLKHWMPMIMASPAHKSGDLLIVITFDEGNPFADNSA